MNLRSLLRRRIRARLWPALRESGFALLSDQAAWRKGGRWIDVVQVSTVGPSGAVIGRVEDREVVASAATFSVTAGVYYTDVHLLPWVGPAPERAWVGRGEAARKDECHRMRTLSRSFRCGNVEATLFPVAGDGSDIDAMLDDALQALRARGLPWLEGTHDIDAYLARRGRDHREFYERSPPLGFTPDEQAQWRDWLARHRIGEGVAFMVEPLLAHMPPNLRAKLEIARLRDHTAMDIPVPYGDLRYGLLLGSGRRDEAIAAMREDADPKHAEALYQATMEADWSDPRDRKRAANAARRREEAYRKTTRERLALLEATPAPPLRYNA